MITVNIRHKLTGAFIIVVLISTAVVIAVNLDRMEKAINSSYEKKAKADAIQTIDFVIRYMLETSSNYVQFLAKDSNLIKATYYAVNIGATQDLQTVLPKFQDRLKLSFIEVMDLNGKILHSTQGSQERSLFIHQSANTFDQRLGEYDATFEYDKNAKQFRIHTDAYIERKGKRIGSIHGGYILDRHLLKALAGDTVLAFYDGTAEFSVASADIQIDKLWLRGVFDAGTKMCSNNPSGKSCTQTQFYVTHKKINGVAHIVVAAPIRVTSKMPVGTMVIAQEASQMEYDLASARDTTLLFSLGGIAIAVLLGSLLSRGFSEPIIQLKNAAIDIGKGNLEARTNIHSKDEIGVLATAFNEMSEALSHTTISKHYVENILQSMADALVVIDVKRRIKTVNRAALEMLGYEEGDLISEDISKIIHDESFLMDVLQMLDERGKVYEKQATFRARDGNNIPVQLAATQVHDVDGEVTDIVFLAQDITERLKVAQTLARKRAELERSNKELDQFAYVTSHDLKAPLRAIANLSQWIEEDIGEQLEGDTRKQMDLLRGRVRRMEDLINGILQYSRVGRVVVDIETVDVGELLAEIIDGLHLPEGISIDIAGQMPVFETARVRLFQVFANLLSNAIKYHDRTDGRVSVSVQDAGEFYEFTVADDGPGIAPEYHNKVFQLFQTLIAKDTLESTGVGLTLVKKIVEDQGGIIELESEVGQGAVFRFTWLKSRRDL